MQNNISKTSKFIMAKKFIIESTKKFIPGTKNYSKSHASKLKEKYNEINRFL